MLLLLLAACGDGVDREAIAKLPRHTLAYTGDLITARRLNHALWPESDAERNELFGDVADVLRGADLAVVNLEGMISMGGYYNQLRSCTWMFRAHPRMTEVLTDMGVDVVTIGNNHNGDYGPDALREQLDHLRLAGIDYAGAGENEEDAARPLYRQLGDTVVAIVSAELSVTEIYDATPTEPGVHFVRKAFKKPEHDDELVAYFREKVAEARQHAHVVVFVPHWDAWKDPPAVTPEMRALAGRLVRDAGFDAILAHGRHDPQGVEVFDGKPVIYDAGNVFLDHSSDDHDSRGMIWQVQVSRAGVHAIEGVPVKMKRNRSRIARGEEQRKAFDRVQRLSAEMGSQLVVKDERARLELDPGGILEPTKGAQALARPLREGGVRWAPTDVLHDNLPEGVTPLDVRFESGIRLVGFELLSPGLVASSCSSQTVVLYWTTDQPVTDSYVVHLEARRVVDGKMADRDMRREEHLPGDWMLPTNLWPVGKVIQDKTNVRLMNDDPTGEIAFLVGMRKLTEADRAGSNGTIVAPLASGDLPRAEELVVIGRTPYADGAKKAADVYETWRKTRRVTLSPSQPPMGAPPLTWD
ncbi:MAG: CapA family protein [Myxococcota bacterium]